jgi:hypothetical protein
MKRFQRTDEDESARENVEEGIQVVGVRTIKPVEEQLCIATRYARENLKRRVGRAIWAILAAHHQNTAIRENECGWIPASTLCENVCLRTDLREAKMRQLHLPEVEKCLDLPPSRSCH